MLNLLLFQKVVVRTTTVKVRVTEGNRRLQKTVTHAGAGHYRLPILPHTFRMVISNRRRTTVGIPSLQTTGHGATTDSGHKRSGIIVHCANVVSGNYIYNDCNFRAALY